MDEEQALSTCTICNREFPTEQLTDFDGELLCSDCHEDETLSCSHCGERIWTDDNMGNDDTPLCAHCYDYHYCTCESCGILLSNNDAYYEDGEDEPYCSFCYDRRERHVHLHDYGYKPDPIFYGNGSRFLGVELEIDEGGKSSCKAEELENIANATDEFLYVKTDGSLDDGLELVTHPMTLEFHIQRMPWKAVLSKALELDYLSHKTGTCGLHVHVNRDSFGDTRSDQEECISRVLFFVERFWQELLKFSRRTESSIRRWANRYGVKDNPKDVLDSAKQNGNGRYTCVNITNYSTIEFRLFRGTLRYTTLIATLQLVDEICRVAVLLSDEDLGSLSWPEFVAGLCEEKTLELIAYLKERRLYVNERVLVWEEEA